MVQQTRFSQVLVLFGLATLVAACGGGLEREDVASIAPGDAVGSAASGEYELELYTTDCRGSCGVDAGFFSVSLCDVGELEYESVEVTQTDGRLVLVGEGLIVERIMGGINRDGSFEIGGWGTQHGGEIEVLVRSTGRLSEDGFTGTAESRGHGRVEDSSVDCTASYEIAGARID